jgi:hypothetical protein
MGMEPTREQAPGWKERWHEIESTWQARLDATGLGAVFGALGDALKPLAPLAAQVLWFSQPGFAVFGQSDAVGALAEMLESPPEPGPDHVSRTVRHHG